LKSNLSDLPDDVASAVESSRGRLGRLATSVRHFAVIGSTNDVAMSLAIAGGAEGAVVIADEQTSGRGRRGRTWFSPPGSGLYVSVVLAPGAGAGGTRATALVTLTVGVALAEGVEVATALAPDIKWPNDLTVGRRKLCGILTEGVAAADAAAFARAPIVVTGFGINVGPMAYPRELADRATSLEVELGRPIDRALLLTELLAALARRYEDLLAGRFDAILDAWRARAPLSQGATVSWTAPEGARIGVTAGIDDEGALIVRTDRGTERIIAGELTWY
jgi:BirA family transcriptional regulator, biotin operon repressor / biotin---[acetyl-CoA-carboxylase] ligase